MTVQSNPGLRCDEDAPGSASVEPVDGLVFLCHSSGDKERVRALYQRLEADGVRCWFDEQDLLPGQEWEYEIGRAIRQSKIVLACLSRASISKRGFVQKELKVALDVAGEQPEGGVYLVPVRLEECDVPDRLKDLQWADLFRDGEYERLLHVINSKTASTGPSPRRDHENSSGSDRHHGERLTVPEVTEVPQSFNERAVAVLKAAWLEAFAEKDINVHEAARADGGVDGWISSRAYPDEKVRFKTLPDAVAQLRTETAQDTLASVDDVFLLLSETQAPAEWLMPLHRRRALRPLFGFMSWSEDEDTAEGLVKCVRALRSARPDGFFYYSAQPYGEARYAYDFYLRTLALADAAINGSLSTVKVVHGYKGKNSAFVLAPVRRQEAKFGLTFAAGKDAYLEVQVMDSLIWLRENGLPGIIGVHQDRVEYVYNHFRVSQTEPLAELVLWRGPQGDEALKQCLGKIARATR